MTKPAKPSPPSTSARETSPAVAATAARLMHSDNADVRKVAASALAQAQPVELSGVLGERVAAERENEVARARTAGAFLAAATRHLTGASTSFNVDDFRAQLPTLLANGGTVGFNLSTRDEVEQAVTVARELGYETRVDVGGLRVEVRRVP